MRADLGIAFYSGDGSLKSVGVNVGTWNSLHIPVATVRATSSGTNPISIPRSHWLSQGADAGIVTVPLGGTSSFGAWNVHGGVEYQALGATTEAFNGGDG